MSNKIGFSNFRKFANFPTIDLGDVTILVGGNNSGKSTLVKALLLCVDNLRMMRMSDRRRDESSPLLFSKPLFRFDANEYHDVKIKTFSRAIHNKPVESIDWETGDMTKVLPSTIDFRFTIGQFAFKFEVAGDRDEESATGDVLFISIEDTLSNIRFTNNYQDGTMCYEILNHEARDEFSAKIKFVKDYKKAKEELEKATDNEDLEEITDLTAEMAKIAAAYKAQFGIDVEATDLEDVDLLNDDAAEKAMWKDTRRSWAKSVAERFDFLPLGILLDEANEPVVENVISNIINFAVSSPDKAPTYKEGTDPGIYGSDIQFYQMIEGYRKAMSLEKDKMLKSQRDLHILLNQFDVQYISAHAANQNTLYSTTDRNDYIAQIVHEYYREKITIGEPEHSFVKNWMNEFGIGADFRINPVIPGEAYQVIIKDEDGSEVPLADKGMGSIQMMILILRLATIIRRGRYNTAPTTIVIEEPEQNLHPKMQSLLAKFFASIAEDKKFNFIIETHSEYLIRKSQALVAEKNYTDEKELEQYNPFKVYYLPTTGGERYQMHYNTSGAFKEKFGSGFFDAATESEMVVIRKEFEQKKKNRK